MNTFAHHNPTEHQKTIPASSACHFYLRSSHSSTALSLCEPAADNYSDNARVPALVQEELNHRLLALIDELAATHAAHSFHYEAIEALMNEHMQIEAKALQGLTVTNTWLRERNDHIIEALDDILTLLRKQQTR